MYSTKKSSNKLIDHFLYPAGHIVGDSYVSGTKDAEVQNHCICEYIHVPLYFEVLTCKKNIHPCTESCLKAVDNRCSQNKTTDINTVPDVLTFKSL